METKFRCHFASHDKTMLIGADPSHTTDRCMRVTIHHCFFDGTRQRHPRVRFAKVHLYNNYTRNWGIYAVCASIESQVLIYDILCLWCYFLVGLVILIFFPHLLCSIYSRYIPNVIYMKRVRRRWLLNT